MENREYTGDSLLQAILQADAEASEMTALAAQEQKQAAERLPAEKEALRAQYASETELMITRTRETSKKTARGKLESIARERDEKLAKLDELAKQRTAAWVEQIYASILRGE